MNPSTLEKNTPDMQTAAMMAALVAVDSLHFVWAKLIHAEMSPVVSPLYVLGISTVEVGIFGLVTGKLNLKVLRDHLWFFIVIGFLIGVATNINYTAIGLLDPGVASLLGQTGTIWGLILGILWLKDRLNPLQGTGAVLAITGLVVINFQGGEYLQLGSLLILISTFSYALHTAITKRFGGQIDFLNFFFYRVLFTSLALLVFTTARGGLSLPPSGKAWLFLLLTGTTDVVISRVLYYIALRRMPMSVHTLFLTASPVVTILWTLIIFGLYPLPKEILGGTIILSGVLLVNLGRQRKSVFQKTGT